jgi:hypothetical protein
MCSSLILIMHFHRQVNLNHLPMLVEELVCIDQIPHCDRSSSYNLIKGVDQNNFQNTLMLPMNS